MKQAFRIPHLLTLIAGGTILTLGNDSSETPIGSRWWPSEWGIEDQRGAANRMTPDRILAARDVIRDGRVFQLGRIYEHGMPIPGKRHFSLTIPGLPTGKGDGTNQLVHNDELISGEIGQVGTQFDGLGHVGVRMGTEYIFYNGNRLSEFGDTYGLKKLGVENVGAFFMRGVLLDIPVAKGVAALPLKYVITPTDLNKAIDLARVQLQSGDAVLIRTGHGRLWMRDNVQYSESEPGIGLEAAKFLIKHQVTLIGSDNWAVEVVPPENPQRPFEVHQWLLVRNGIYLIENLDLDELSAAKCYLFAFAFAPLRLKGATGSPGNPIAIR